MVKEHQGEKHNVNAGLINRTRIRISSRGFAFIVECRIRIKTLTAEVQAGLSDQS